MQFIIYLIRLTTLYLVPIEELLAVQTFIFNIAASACKYNRGYNRGVLGEAFHGLQSD